MCGVCGRRPVTVLINPLRNPHSRAAQRGRRVALKAHDCCRLCWRAIIEPIFAAAQAARLETRRVA